MDESTRTSSLHILIVDDEANIRRTLAIGLEANGHKVVAVSNAADATAECRRQSFDLAFVDLRLGSTQGLDLIPAILLESPWLKVVVITAYGTIDSAVEAIRRGAYDYLTKPFTPAQVNRVIERIVKVRAEHTTAVEGADGSIDAAITLQSTSVAMQRAVDVARQVAPTDATVLIRGESGTGKGVLGKAIHGWSKRAERPFATVSCPSLSPQLLESDLFGHVKGAFTGAFRDNPGRISASDGGTIFLDEIGDLPLDLQPKLLRFVQDREFERVGDASLRHADVRIISATNVDLAQAVKQGQFREDLFYRIKVVQIEVPPLRERPDDIVLLAERMLSALKGSRTIAGFNDAALAALRGYSWPGNVRELRNAIEFAVIFCRGDSIGVEHLPLEVTSEPRSVDAANLVSLDRLEEMHIRRVLGTSRSLDDAARVLGIDVATLWRRRKKYRI